MRSFRNIIFWLHLIAGLLAGVVIFIMSFTGALLSFEKNIIEYYESDVRYIASDQDINLTPQQIIVRLNEQKPESKPTAMSITNEPNATWMFSLGREGQIFVNRVNGEIVGSGNHDIRSLMSEFRNWHRWIALSGDNRPMGKAITGVSNLLFLFVAISGFYIWMPRKFNWKLLKPVVFFRQGLRGKARNFNWHNVIGFWTSLFLIIFTLTATVISYQWASNLLYTMTGNEVPKQSENSKEKPNETVLSDEVWQKAESQAPKWKSISLKLPVTSEGAVFTIDEGVYWNIFGRSNLTIDPATSSILKWEPYGDQNAGRQLRTWFRFTHTGETGGMIGQIVGFIVCIGACFLVWTGFSLAFRRFGKWIKKRKEPLPAEPV